MPQTSGTALTAVRMFTGKPPAMTIRNECPAPIAIAFCRAISTSASSLPVWRTRASPDDSQKAMPNFICGADVTMASWRSSTVLMKWAWPRMTFMSSGLSTGTTLMSMTPSSKGLAPLFLRQDAVSLGRVGRKDVLDREVHPDQHLGVRRRGQDAVADLLDGVLHRAPPRLVGPIAVLETDRRRSEGLAPLGELLDHLVGRLEDLAVVDEHDAVADGRGHDVLVEMLQEHAVGGVVEAGRGEPGPGQVVGHRVAEVGVVGAVPLDVDADPDDAFVAAV